MVRLLIKASTSLRKGLLFRQKRAMREYFQSMKLYRELLSQQARKSGGSSVEEYIAKLARTPSPIELEQRTRQGPGDK
jgi:hypothetical protein